MNLSGLAGSLGAAFSGYGVDRARALQQAMLARGMEGTDFDRTLRLRQAGYAPVGDLQTALQQASQSAQAPVTDGLTDSVPTGTATDPAVLAKQIAGNVAQNRTAANQVPGTPANLASAFQVPGEATKWAQLPFDQTPAGLAIRKGQEIDKAKQDNELQRELARNAATAADKRTTAAAERAQRVAQIQSFDPTMSPARASAIANDEKLYNAWGTAQFAPKPIPPVKPPRPIIQKGQDAQGNPLFFSVDDSDPKHPKMIPMEGGTPIKAGGAAGGQTRLPERTQQLGLALHNAVEALPFHDQVVADPDAGPGLATGWLGEKSQAGHQPARWALNQTDAGSDYEKYLDAINGSLLAVAHSVGGARINKEQINMFGGNMMLSSGDGDHPKTVEQKTRAIIDFMNSARATLPPDAVAQQEALLPPDGLAFLRSKGYGEAPTPEGMAKVAQVRSLGGYTPDAPEESAAPTGPAPTAAHRWEELVKGGMDKAAATAQVKREFKAP